MTRLPRNVSGRECVKVLERAGFQVRRQSGSHIIMRREDPAAIITVPDHRELKPGTLRAIIRQADLTIDEFIALR